VLRKCIYKGGTDCSRQGGDGSLHHQDGYVHPYPTSSEAGTPLGELVVKSFTQEETYSLSDFAIDFDEDKSNQILSLEISKSIIDVEDLIKSFYEFDLDSEEGVRKLLELLPVLDPEIVVELVEKIWPGYVVENADPDLLRAEVQGYLLDYLGEDE